MQFEMDDEPINEENVPAGHALHEKEMDDIPADSEQVPAGHLMHASNDVALVWKEQVPEGHWVHDDKEVPFPYVPTGHLEHSNDPHSDEKNPGLQGLQESLEYVYEEQVPGWQTSYCQLPNDATNCPAEAALQ